MNQSFGFGDRSRWRGKDSIVTLELLGDLPGSIPLILNPRGASLNTVLARGYSEEDYIDIRRTIDPALLKLNDEGFLNGHTPFSALLGFVCALAAVISGKRFVALSNESSANEATIPGTTINHQYSKSVAYEKDFRHYPGRYLAPEVEYFSFLRPLNELQISRLFTGYPEYFPLFRSCNAGSKTDSWCGKCSKCLFSYIILSPFYTRGGPLNGIFGRDLFDDPDLIHYFDQLTGLQTRSLLNVWVRSPKSMRRWKLLSKEKKSADLPLLLPPLYQVRKEEVTSRWRR